MVFGAIGGLLVAVFFTLVTGKLQLTKNRIVYGTPARIIALLALLPMIGLVVYVLKTGNNVNQPGGLGMFGVMIFACVLIMYVFGWPFGQPPRN